MVDGGQAGHFVTVRCLFVILCRHITKTRSHDLRVEGVESAQNVKPPEANCLWELELYK